MDTEIIIQVTTACRTRKVMQRQHRGRTENGRYDMNGSRRRRSQIYQNYCQVYVVIIIVWSTMSKATEVDGDQRSWPTMV